MITNAYHSASCQTRRHFLCHGAVGLNWKTSKRSVVIIRIDGGLKHVESFDPKPTEARLSKRANDIATVESSTGEVSLAGGAGDSGSGGGGESEEGGDDDGEPPIVPLMSQPWDWWQTSAVIAAIVTITVFALWCVYGKPNRHLFATLLVVFLTSFGVSVYFNPRLWFGRMAEACLGVLVANHFVAGLKLRFPVSWSSEVFELSIPDTHWSLHVVVGLAMVAFATLHFIRDWRIPPLPLNKRLE